jgi:phosphoglucosamine mutase
MRRLFGTDGIRGIANEFLSCERAMAIGRALGYVLSSNNRYRPKVIIGMDTRLSSEMLASAVTAGLLSVGSDVMTLGVVPTPAVAYLVKKYKAKAGVMISASHNPYEYNGIKVFGEEGFKLSDELEEQIESIVLDNTPPIKIAVGSDIGKRCDATYALDDYISYLKGTVNTRLDGMRVAIDSSNGSASVTAEKLFTSLGAKVYMLSDKPDGININDRCGSTHIESVKKYVIENKLEAGIAFDGDADRCLAVDENGREIDGDIIMAILALDMKKKGLLNKNTVVGTVMSNFGFHKFCEENGINFIAAKVGDRYVLEIINQEGYSFGGEQSGHVIIRSHATTGDGQLTALALLTHIKESGKTLGELSRVMKKYPQHMVNIEATQNQKIALFTDEEIKAILSEAEKALSERGRLVVRPSGTEPLVRIMVECDDQNETVKITESLAEKIKKRLADY